MSRSNLNYSKAVCILSGGVDSTTLLYNMLILFDEVHVLSFNYGQRHKKELIYAKKTCKILNLNHEIIDLSCLKNCLLGSSLTSRNIKVPHGHYEAESMKSTVVPNRNSIMLNIAFAKAISINAGVVGYGAHSGDHFIYKDCRPEFLEAIVNLGSNIWSKPLSVHAPFMNLTKCQIVEYGKTILVPYQNTWSCYEGNSRPCLKCGTCQERTIAFRDANHNDPLLTKEEWINALKIVKGTK